MLDAALSGYLGHAPQDFTPEGTLNFLLCFCIACLFSLLPIQILMNINLPIHMYTENDNNLTNCHHSGVRDNQNVGLSFED